MFSSGWALYKYYVAVKCKSMRPTIEIPFTPLKTRNIRSHSAHEKSLKPYKIPLKQIERITQYIM